MEIQRPSPGQPRPADAKKVFEGVIYDVYQWEQELFDKTTATFETLSRADTTVVVPVTKEGEILVVRQEQPGKPVYWSFPGGRIEKGERPDASALRELLEETGYTSGDLEFWYGEQPVSKIDWAIYIFVARDCRLVSESKLDGGERIEVVPMEFGKVMELGRRGELGSEFAVHCYKAELEPAYTAELKRLFGI